jgi:predicted glycosyltransferase
MKEGTVLNEPVRDIYSIIRHSRFVISSGDSLAREACVLGIPTIYAGWRNMAVNKELIEMGCMFKENSMEEIKARIEVFCSRDMSREIEEKIHYKIHNEWDNPTEVILKHVEDFKR